MNDPRQALHSQLKDVTRRYGHAMDRYTQAMHRGDVARADEAMSDMQEIEAGIKLIVIPGRR